MKLLIIISFLFVCISVNAQSPKTYKMEFYAEDLETEEFINYSNVTAINKQSLDTSYFVCELVNVYDPDNRYEVSKFDFTVKIKNGEQNFIGMNESALLEKIIQIKSNPDGSSAAIITITKVYYKNSQNVELNMSVKDFDYNIITVF
jgi:hypothetical protein